MVSTVLLVVLGWQLRSNSSPRPAALRDTARRAGLAITPEVEPTLIPRLRAQTRAAVIGAMLAIVVGTVVLLLLPTPDAVTTAPFLLVVLVGLGAVVGNAIAEGRAALRPLDDSPRLARTPTPSRTDYLSDFDRRFAPVSLWVGGIALIGLAMLITMNPQGSFGDSGLVTLWLPGAILWALALAAAVVGRILTTRVLQRGQPARDDVELAWSDALRSRTLSVFAQVPAIGAFCGLALALLSVNSGATGDSSAALSISLWSILAVAVCTVVFSGAAVWTTVTTRTPHYLQRLWPDVAAQLRDQTPAAPVVAGRAPQ